MKTSILQLYRFEFEARIFISLSIVLLVCLTSFLGFPAVPSNMIIAGNWLGMDPSRSLRVGFVFVTLVMILATILRMWAGTVLSSPRIMAFRIQKDVLATSGPYHISRNPIYLADLVAFCGFSLCLNPVGLAMPVLLYIHYIQLITYEEHNLCSQFGVAFEAYRKATPRLIPNLTSLKRYRTAFSEFYINRDGFRHNAQYLLFIPGFVILKLFKLRETNLPETLVLSVAISIVCIFCSRICSSLI